VGAVKAIHEFIVGADRRKAMRTTNRGSNYANPGERAVIHGGGPGRLNHHKLFLPFPGLDKTKLRGILHLRMRKDDRSYRKIVQKKLIGFFVKGSTVGGEMVVIPEQN